MRKENKKDKNKIINCVFISLLSEGQRVEGENIYEQGYYVATRLKKLNSYKKEGVERN